MWFSKYAWRFQGVRYELNLIWSGYPLSFLKQRCICSKLKNETCALTDIFKSDTNLNLFAISIFSVNCMRANKITDNRIIFIIIIIIIIIVWPWPPAILYFIAHDVMKLHLWSVLFLITLSILYRITALTLNCALARMLFSVSITGTDSCSGSNWWHCFVKVQWTLNLTYVKMCSISPHQTVNKRETYTDFSVLHGNLLLIQDLIVWLPDEDNKLYRHIKHAPLMLK